MSESLVSAAVSQEWAQAVNKFRDAAESVGEMAGHTAAAVGAMAGQVAGDAGQKADELTATLGVGIQDLGDKFSRNAPQEGLLGSASQAVARRVHDGGEYLADARLSGIGEDLAHVIRRNPIPAVLVAVGLGWFAARTLRG